MEQQKLIPHLFRTEFRKITAVLTRFLGIEHLELAEDIVSETFVLALETWPYHGIPDNPSAWLYAVAKNKAKNQLKRQQLFQVKIMPDLMNTSVRARSQHWIYPLKTSPTANYKCCLPFATRPFPLNHKLAGFA